MNIGTFILVPARAVRTTLTATDWAVLAAICLHIDTNGRAVPSMARIAEIAGINRSHVPRSLTRLELSDLLRRKRSPRRTGGWQASHYEVVLRSWKMSPRLVTLRSEVMSPRLVTSMRKRCHLSR